MSVTPLSDIQEVVERSIFYAILQECIDKGYTPDRLLYPSDNAGTLAYDAAVTAIASGPRDFCIEVFNHSNTEAKGLKKIPRIVIVPTQNLPGALGGSNDRLYVPDIPNKFYVEVLPPQTTDLNFEIHLLSNNSKQARILTAILALALPKRGYIPRYDDSAQKLFIHNYSFRRFENTQLGILENVYMCEVPDIWETENIIIPGPRISKITEITVEEKLIKPNDLLNPETGPIFKVD